MINNYEFAGVIFKINTIHSYFHNYAKDYITSKKAKENITVSKDEIDNWIKEHNVNVSIFPFEYIETLVIHSKLADILALYNVFIFHGSSIYLDSKDNAYIFTATSGTGKSTHVNLLMKNYPNRINYINDDKPFISIENNNVYVYGSPFDGKERKSNNIKCQVNGIFILSRGKDNLVNKINSKDALNIISNQLHLPISQRERAFQFIFKLLKLVDFYDLKVNMLDEASETSYSIMAKN